MSVPRSSHAPDFLSEPSLDALKQALPLVTTVSLAIIAIISFFIFSNRSSFPLANPPAWYQPKLVKKLEFLKDGYNIYAEARKRYGKQPYRMISHLGEVLILPPSYAQDIRNESRLDFGKSQVRDFSGHVPGFEPFGTIGSKTQILQNVVKKQLTKALNTVTQPLSQEASYIVDHMFGNEPEWKEMTAVPELTDLVARLSSKIFLGDQLCRNEAWLELSKQYTKTSFPTAGEVAIMPKPLKHLAHLFHPGIKQLRRQLQDAGAILQPILDQRAQAKAEAKKKGEPAPVYNDMLEWIQQQAGDELVEPVHYQMSLTFAAIHTTSDLLTQTLIRLANEPHLIEDLRKEIIEVLTTEGLAKASLANLKLMDSAMKEAQRVNPITLMGMRRLATESFTLTGGIKIKKGDYVMVDASNSLDPEIYPDPRKYDMYRFYRMRQDPATANKAHLVSTSVENISFGHGIHACPGRFFAANEIKIALCHLLLKYDWELAPGASVEPYILFAENMALNPDNKLRYRRRKEELDLEALCT